MLFSQGNLKACQNAPEIHSVSESSIGERQVDKFEKLYIYMFDRLEYLKFGQIVI